MTLLPKRLRLPFRVLWSTFALVGLAWIIAMFTPITAWYSMALARASGWRHGDYPTGIRSATVILLAGSGGPMEGLGADSMIRCNRALNYWRTGRVRRIIITGFSVSRPMQEFLLARGIPQEIISVEPHAHSTRQNALTVRSLLPPGETEVVVLSSDYHVFRASRAFSRAGLPNTPVIAWDAYLQAGDWTERTSAIIAEVQETNKILYYWLRGWI